MKRLLVLFACLIALPLAGQSLRRDMVVTTEWLAGHPDRITLLEIGDRTTYAAAHLPGARLIELTEIVVDRDGTPNELPPIEALEAAFTRAGVGDGGRIVLYSRDPLHAARAWFTLDYLGHGGRASILDGGFAKWTAENRPTTTDMPQFAPAPFHARVRSVALARFKVIHELVRFHEVLGRDLAILDARPPVQFSGKEPGADVKRPGHIPGAVNVAWTENLAAGEIPRLLPERELRELYVRAGVSADSTNIVYCRTGMEASLTYFVLKYLGYEASLYDGSYVEWAKDPNTATV